MTRVVGIGGIFFKARDADVDPDGNRLELWEPPLAPWPAGPCSR